ILRSNSTTATSSHPSSPPCFRNTKRSIRGPRIPRRTTSARSMSEYAACARATNFANGRRVRRGRPRRRPSSSSWLSRDGKLLSHAGRDFFGTDRLGGFVDVIAERDRDPGGGPDDREKRQPPRRLDAEQTINGDGAWPGEHQRGRDRQVRHRQLRAALVDPDWFVAMFLAPRDDHRRARDDRADRRKQP